jgi:hypothetical protein
VGGIEALKGRVRRGGAGGAPLVRAEASECSVACDSNSEAAIEAEMERQLTRRLTRDATAMRS